jgi:hypothetical protein
MRIAIALLKFPNIAKEDRLDNLFLVRADFDHLPKEDPKEDMHLPLTKVVVTTQKKKLPPPTKQYKIRENLLVKSSTIQQVCIILSKMFYNLKIWVF